MQSNVYNHDVQRSVRIRDILRCETDYCFAGYRRAKAERLQEVVSAVINSLDLWRRGTKDDEGFPLRLRRSVTRFS